MEHSPVPKRDIILDDAESDSQIGESRPSRALVPLAGGDSSRVTGFAITHPDLSFVAHLIATATHAPQTRTLCRASSMDAQMSYRSVVHQNKQPARPVGKARVA
ncbi:hypothetical protein [Bradyrhizobium prioriisuperbiae]|uniref:hypothetical protein n=1 Tax=Bradyrhizobium prioriisuperbiae TaxID=2854389 RepID=UPI0028E2EE5E|nr:hypothetical protein [Bradyrhizobium prioritasuperba]